MEPAKADAMQPVPQPAELRRQEEEPLAARTSHSALPRQQHEPKLLKPLRQAESRHSEPKNTDAAQFLAFLTGGR